MQIKLSEISYSLRNSLVLLLIFIFVASIFNFINFRKAKRLKEINVKHNELIKVIDRLDKQINSFGNEAEMEAALLKMEKEASRQDKMIVKTDAPASTYRYLMDISDRYCPDFKFDFKLSNDGKVKGVDYNEYTIFGDASIKSLYIFIYQLENQSRLYTIDNLLINSTKAENGDLVRFSLTIRAFYANNGYEPKAIPFKPLKRKSISYNPFYPRIHEPISISFFEGMLRVEDLVLTGLTPEMAIVKDNSQNMHMIKVNDKVAYGYLAKIDWDRQRVTFNINKIGITERVTLSMEQ